MSQSNQYVGLDVSLKETSICVIDDADKIVWRGRVDFDAESHRIGREAARAPCGSDRARKRAAVELAVPRVERGWAPGDLRRCAPRQGGAVAQGQQDRRQRRPRPGADHARRLVPRGDGEGPRLPSRACAAGGARPDRVADHDAEELRVAAF